MGKSWFAVVKKAFTPRPKQKKDEQKPHKAKKWFGKSKKLDGTNPNVAGSLPSNALCVAREAKIKEIEEEQSRHAYSVAVATAAAADAAVAAAQAAAEVVRLTAISRFPGKSKEEVAAIKIQTAFRGYMAKRALRALRGLVRLKSLVQGKGVRRQATSTLQSMQTLARLQYQIRERRLRLSEDKQACARKLQQKHNKEFSKIGGNWDDSTLSRERVEANMLNKQVATMRREKALAYAYTHQNTLKGSSISQTFMDPNNPHWGWSWLERWMAARPNENQSITLTPPDNADKTSSAANSVASRARSEIIPRVRKPSPRRITPPSSRRMSSPGVRQAPSGDEDSKSRLSIQSEQPGGNRRHSIGGSLPSTRDDESSIASSIVSQSVPGYMALTQAAKARARLSNLSPLGSEKTVKKRLSFNDSPNKTVRRFSGPPKLESSGNNNKNKEIVLA
ncbi:IQD3 [Hirschfeldia incana]|nr:IQD3 [Hirschfeldia incana]